MDKSKWKSSKRLNSKSDKKWVKCNNCNKVRNTSKLALVSYPANPEIPDLTEIAVCRKCLISLPANYELS